MNEEKRLWELSVVVSPMEGSSYITMQTLICLTDEAETEKQMQAARKYALAALRSFGPENPPRAVAIICKPLKV